jgi:hypothetical protein
MTTPIPFGQTLANAESTLTEVLRLHLAERDTTPETWYALQLIATLGPKVPRRALSERLERSRTLTPDSTRDLLVQLEGEGLICGASEVDLTSEGQILHRRLRDYIAGPTTRLLGQFDPDDIDTTVRTLRAITDLAAEELVEQ